MKFNKPLAAVLTAVVSIALAHANVWADSIEYGDIVGATYTYEDVTESSKTNPGPLYGTPKALADTLTFDPENFELSVKKDDFDFTDGQLGTTVTGSNISDLWFSESGDYFLYGFGDAMVSVTQTYKIRVDAIDGVSVSDISDQLVVQQKFTLKPGDDPVNGAWEASAHFDIAQMLASHNLAGVATAVHISLDNSLLAQADARSGAFIEKKEVKIKTAAVPEPASLSLLGLGVVGLCAARRRRQR